MAANTSATSVPTSIKPNPSKKEKETLLAVLQFLKKNKLPVSYRIVMRVTLRFFERKSFNASCCVCFLQETEKIFRQEVNGLEDIEEINLQTTPDSEADISSVLSAYNR